MRGARALRRGDGARRARGGRAAVIVTATASGARCAELRFDGGMTNAGANAELAAATGENASANFASERRSIIDVVIYNISK